MDSVAPQKPFLGDMCSLEAGQGLPLGLQMSSMPSTQQVLRNATPCARSTFKETHCSWCLCSCWAGPPGWVLLALCHGLPGTEAVRVPASNLHPSRNIWLLWPQAASKGLWLHPREAWLIGPGRSCTHPPINTPAPTTPAIRGVGVQGRASCFPPPTGNAGEVGSSLRPRRPDRASPTAQPPGPPTLRV